MIETATGIASLRDDGIAHITIRDGVEQSLPQAKENLAALITLAGDRRRPLLINMSGARPLEPDVRHFYGDASLSLSFTALGLVVESSSLGRMMGNVYLRIARADLPMQLFSDEHAAITWLLRQR